MEIEVSIGEIVDKLSILKIKRDNITDSVKLDNINREYFYLNSKVFDDLKIDNSDFDQLYLINKKLWLIEDKIRTKEKNGEFDIDFIEIARSVYITNDERTKIKNYINLKYDSIFIEEKSYMK